MRSPVIGFVLCIFATSTFAQCAPQASVAHAAQPRAELIKTAAAGTHPGQLAVEDGLPVISEAATAAKSDDKSHRRAGPAMLLAALALMSGIALRRYFARMK